MSTQLSDYVRLFEEGDWSAATRALTYARWERLYFRIFGHWPKRVVDRRIDAMERDRVALRRSLAGLRRS